MTSTMHADTPALQLTGVRKTFGSVTAVDDVSLVIDPGEIVAFLGPNGTGKTSTIDMVLGLSKPTAGSLSVFGMAPELATSTGMVSAVLQTGGLLKDFTVRETAALTASLFAQSTHRPRPPRHPRTLAHGDYCEG